MSTHTNTETRRVWKRRQRATYRAMWPTRHGKRHQHRKLVKGSLRDGSVYVWPSGFVTALNGEREQIYELCGMYGDVVATVVRRRWRSTRYYCWADGQWASITGDVFATLI